VVGPCVIIPEAEVPLGADSAIAFCFDKHAGSSRYTSPMEDTSVHLLVDPYLLFGHKCLWCFESRCF